MKTVVWIFLAVAWGLTWLAVRLGLADLPPVTFAALRFLLAATVLWPALFLKRSQFTGNSAAWKIIVSTSVLTIALPYSLQFWGQQYVSSGLAAVMFATVPLFTIVFAHWSIPGDTFTVQKLGGVLLGILGVSLIFSDQLGADRILVLWGCLGFLVGAATHALSQVVIKARGQDIDPLMLATGQISIGGVVLLLLGVTVEGSPFAIRWTMQAVLSLVYLALVGSALAFFLFYWLLRRAKVTTVASMALVHPVVAVLAGRVVMNETLGWTVVLGSCCVLGGLGLLIFWPARSSDLNGTPKN